jgi:hypothetical protein
MNEFRLHEQIFNLLNSEGKLSDHNHYSFKAVNNINEYACETSLTVKQVLHHWNMTVQFWMANNVYKRVPIKKYGYRYSFLLLRSSLVEALRFIE